MLQSAATFKQIQPLRPGVLLTPRAMVTPDRVCDPPGGQLISVGKKQAREGARGCVVQGQTRDKDP